MDRARSSPAPEVKKGRRLAVDSPLVPSWVASAQPRIELALSQRGASPIAIYNYVRQSALAFSHILNTEAVTKSHYIDFLHPTNK